MEVIKCKYILISKLTKKHKYFLFFLLGSLLRFLSPCILNKVKNKNFDNNNELNHLLTQKYLEIMRNIISNLILGFFHCYNTIINKDEIQKRKSQKNSSNNKLKINYIFNDKYNSASFLFRYIFLISLIDMICQLLIPLKYILEEKVFKYTTILTTEPYYLYTILFFDIFARYIFSRYILKTYFYCHHKLSFFLSLLGLMFIGIVDIFHKIKIKSDGNPNGFDLLYVSILSVQIILYSFEDIMNKVVFRKLGILPSTLIFYNGLFLLVYFIVISIVFFFCKLYDFKNDLDSILYELQYSLCFIPFNILRNYNILNVIDKFSAQHMTFLRVTEIILIFIFSKFIVLFELKDKKSNYSIYEHIFQYSGFTILLISTLIHNEIIIINHRRLKEKTEFYLDKDADKEQNSSFYTDSFFSDTKNESNSQSIFYDDINASNMS